MKPVKHRKKRMPGRRRRALNWLALLLVLTAALGIFDRFAFLPAQALYQSEEWFHTGRTEVVQKKLAVKTAQKTTLFPQVVYLSERDDTVLLTAMTFGAVSGWQRSTGTTAAEIPAGAELYGRVVIGGSIGRTYGFLRVSDPAVTAVEVQLQEEGASGQMETSASFRTEASAWTERDENRYFLFVHGDIPGWLASQDPHLGEVYLRLTALGAGGEVLAEYDEWEENSR